MFLPTRTFGKTWVKSLWSCCKKTETLALTRLAKTFYWRVVVSWFFLNMITRQITQVHQFISEFLELQKYLRVTDCYRMFCFWQILLFVCCLLILMLLWLVLSGMNHREVGIQYILHQYEFRMSSQQYLSGDLFSYTNGACEVSIKFWVVKFSSFG